MAGSAAIPELTTARLRLRGHRIEDFDECAALWADPGVVRHITGTPSTREQSWSRLLRYAGHWVHLGFGYWAIEERTTGLYVGEAGFADYRRDIEPSLEGCAEAGWLIAPRWQGRGFATEAVSALVAWGDRNLPQDMMACMISPENMASVRVAERVGFTPWTAGTYLGDTVQLYRRAARRD
ncbi:GNAT family N-acetyltransferase [Stappia taiwanensis]|uniref:GNAT family N-acetyltransferase n=1 Tax=Stappia taiwanensis TaxID=992267 RepID=A0A838XZP4_9HYPH|nr:GNAT family N-acetyltransferase [Stappia taiwanensis]MBA4612210.1 GNAT family N-acetyltransferase [Stappia taiwanensis]GGE92740.1 N-acetyltransferase [Stappia taiwanensis]